MKKRIISGSLTFVMLFSLLLLSAFAENDTPNVKDMEEKELPQNSRNFLFFQGISELFDWLELPVLRQPRLLPIKH